MTMAIYKVGMGSDVAFIQAESALAAAMHYGLFCINTNNPFLVVCYEEDGQPYLGAKDWMSFSPDEAHVERIFAPNVEAIQAARVIDELGV